MVVTDVKLLYCHGVAEGNMDRKFSTLGYNNRTVYDCFNNPFTDDFFSPALNLPPITFNDIPRPHKRNLYTPYLIPAAISVASENSFITLTPPSDSPDILPSDDPNTLRVMKKGVPFLGRVKIGYCYGENDQNICYKKTRFYCSICSNKNKKIYYCHWFSRINSETRTCFLEHHNSMSRFFTWFLCLYPFHPLIYLLSSFCAFFLLFHWSLPVKYHISALIEILILYCFCWLFECMWLHTGHTSKMYWPYSFL